MIDSLREKIHLLITENRHSLNSSADVPFDIERFVDDLIDQYHHYATRQADEARLNENERYLEMLKTGEWRSFGTEVTERITELRARLDNPIEEEA